MNCSKFTELYMIKEYQPTTNRYYVRIKLNYVHCTIWHADRNCLYTVYTIWMCCVFAWQHWQDWNCFIPVAHLPSNL